MQRAHLDAASRQGRRSLPHGRGHIVVDSIERIRLADITSALARESGFNSVKDLIQIAKHGPGDNVYLIRFRYLPPGAWDVPRIPGEGRNEGIDSGSRASSERSQLLRRLRNIEPKRLPAKAKRTLTTGRSHRRKKP